VHGLVGQWAEVRAQSSNHPTRQVDVLLGGGAEVLLVGNHLLLSDETVPATQGLGVLAGIGIVLGHVFTHDGGGVCSDVQTGAEAVLHDHASSVFWVNSTPGTTELGLNGANVFQRRLICSHDDFLFRVKWCQHARKQVLAESPRSLRSVA